MTRAKISVFPDEDTQAPGKKMEIMSELSIDYFTVRERIDREDDPSTRRGLAILLGLISSTLGEYEQ